jgi:hypothetical protein
LSPLKLGASLNGTTVLSCPYRLGRLLAEDHLPNTLENRADEFRELAGANADELEQQDDRGGDDSGFDCGFDDVDQDREDDPGDDNCADDEDDRGGHGCGSPLGVWKRVTTRVRRIGLGR